MIWVGTLLLWCTCKHLPSLMALLQWRSCFKYTVIPCVLLPIASSNYRFMNLNLVQILERSHKSVILLLMLSSSNYLCLVQILSVPFQNKSFYYCLSFVLQWLVSLCQICLTIASSVDWKLSEGTIVCATNQSPLPSYLVWISRQMNNSE